MNSFPLFFRAKTLIVAACLFLALALQAQNANSSCDPSTKGPTLDPNAAFTVLAITGLTN